MVGINSYSEMTNRDGDEPNESSALLKSRRATSSSSLFNPSFTSLITPLRERPNPHLPRSYSSALLSQHALDTAFSSLNNDSTFILPSIYTPSGTEPPSRDEEAFPDHHPRANEDVEPEPEESLLRGDLYIILGGLWVGSFLSAADSTIVATCLKPIGSEFKTSQWISWLGTSYLMTQTAAQPLYGKCASIFGRRAVCIFSSAVFLLGSLGCGLSRTYPQLLAARALAGVGGGGLTVMTAVVTSDLVPLRRRGLFQGFVNIVYSAGASLGGPIGGLMSDTVGWRYAFFIQVPICILHLGMVLWKIENSFDGKWEPVDIRTKINRVDFGGSAILVSAVFSLLFGLSLGGNFAPWHAPIVWGTISGGVGLIITFVLYETFVAEEPLLAPRLLFTRTPGFVSLTNWFLSMAQFSMLYSIPVYFSAIQGYSNGRSGLYLIPSVISTSIASLGAGFWMSHTGRYKGMLIVFGVFTVISPLCTVFWDRHTTPEGVFWISMIPQGLGYGGILTITLVALISAVAPEDMASAVGGSYLFRATGSVLGISLSTVILQNSLTRELPKVVHGPDAESIINQIREDISFIDQLAPALQDAVVGAYENSMRSVFMLTTAFGVVCLVCILPIKHHELPSRLDRKK